MTSTGPVERHGWAARALGLGGGVAVALGAGVATAHGLYEVAVAAHVPTPLAWLYPLITDGLALVAYAATARLAGHGRRYAWAVVVLAAGLSGLAQATYLAGGVGAAPPMLRFGVGAWPAIAAAIVAHLLFLLGTDTRQPSTIDTPADPPAVQPDAVQPDAVQPSAVQVAPVKPAVQPAAVQPAREPSNDRPPNASLERTTVQPPSSRVRPPGFRGGSSPASDAARSAARRHHAKYGTFPTVTQLMELADVGRGTAGAVLKELRELQTPLHVVPIPDDKAQP